MRVVSKLLGALLLTLECASLEQFVTTSIPHGNISRSLLLSTQYIQIVRLHIIAIHLMIFINLDKVDEDFKFQSVTDQVCFIFIVTNFKYLLIITSSLLPYYYWYSQHLRQQHGYHPKYLLHRLQLSQHQPCQLVFPVEFQP